MDASFTDDDLLPISKLNDYLFCARRAALQLVERMWHDNVHTVSGSIAHRRVHHERESCEASGYRTVRGMRLVSWRMGLVGVADVVEFRPVGAGGQVLFPVEYKHGRRRRWDNDDVQLCAQALCLEEMLDVRVPCGAIFHVKSKRRREVTFTPQLRARTEAAARELHELVRTNHTPLPVYHKKCEQCSLIDVCLPKAPRPRATAARYLEKIIHGDHDDKDLVADTQVHSTPD